jgi:hypothetical protein
MPTMHVVPPEAGWAVTREHDEERVSPHNDAEAAATLHARGHGDVEVAFHGRDGRVRDPDTMDRAHEGAGRDTVR